MPSRESVGAKKFRFESNMKIFAMDPFELQHHFSRVDFSATI
jgi:hypothetical protein